MRNHDVCDDGAEALLRGREGGVAMQVLLVDPLAVRRQGTAVALRASGWRVRESSTPLELIVHLGDASAHPQVIAIADTVPSSIADELRAYMRREHAHLPLVRMIATAA